MYILKKFLGNEFEHFNAIIANYNLEQNSYINLTACVSYPFQEVLDVQAMPLATVPTEGTRTASIPGAMPCRWPGGNHRPPYASDGRGPL